MEAYCVKCKQKREIQNPEPTFTASGSPATRGSCPVCGSKLYRMGRTEAHAGLEPPPARPRSANSRHGKLVIVESPAKARTVGRFLGQGYQLKASVGHVRDLLRSQLSVDVENDFEPKYRVPNEKRSIVKDLKKAAARAKEVYLATDPDREGEAIAWHLLEAAEINPDQARRVVFHEITEEAIHHAFTEPRAIDLDLVDAQQARRILDRLVGYNLSPILWAKVRSRLSAGRVQSAALRIVVDREREIEEFQAREYWTLDADFLHPEKPPGFRARLVRVDAEEPSLPSEAAVAPLLVDLRRAKFKVAEIQPGTRTRRPLPPFTTSTLQQSAARRLRFTARKTMVVAQQLYEGIDLNSHEPTGLITYMRTDSSQVASSAQAEARAVVTSSYGKEYLPDRPPFYRAKSRTAQEAHEAVRPTSSKRTPESIRSFLSPEQFKLYELIWNRFIASQMKPAVYETLTIEVEGASADHAYQLRVNASSLRFAGFLRVHPDWEGGDLEGEISLEKLPQLEKGDPLQLEGLFPEQHFTEPPPRYNDASLIKALEEYGIGRPSTYAPILSTLEQRGYVRREKRRMIPTEIGVIVNDLLVEHFPEIVDLGFTARMEEELDKVASGERNWVELLRDFYGPFEEQLALAQKQMPEMKADAEPLGRACPECGNQLLIRHGRFGKFIGCSNFPECRHTEPWLEKIGVRCPLDGGELVERRTRKGRIFYGCSNYPSCEFTSWKKPEPTPCPNCGGLLVHETRKAVRCLQCDRRFDPETLPSRLPDVAR
ncbi:MAG TPA: type I DNA topoisomerase [Anaerolineales bacterium]